MKTLAPALAFITLVLVAPAHALSIVDQENPGPNHIIFGGGNLRCAQTFTVGRTGLLTGFDFGVGHLQNATDTFTIDVRPTVGGVPLEDPSTSLFSVTLPSSEFTTIQSGTPMKHFDLTSQFWVQPGDILALTVSQQSNTLFVAEMSGDLYKGGRVFSSPPGQTWRPGLSTYDALFRTFVQPIPEPTTALMASIALSAITWMACGRRTSPVRSA